MGNHSKLPDALAARSERRGWFSRRDAEELLGWLEDSGCRFVGMEVAQKLDDGNWMLLDDPVLDLKRQTDNFEAVRMGRVFLSEYDGEGRMFEPLWQDTRA